MKRRFARPNLLAIFGLTAGIFFSAAQPGVASLITFVAQGTVTSVDTALVFPFQPPSPVFSVGDAFTVTFTFDSLTPDSNPDPNRGRYSNAITSLSVTVGAYTATASGNNSISVDNDLPFGTGDRYFIDLSAMSGPSLNAFDVSSQTALLIMADSSGHALSSEALPISPADLAGFTLGGGGLALQFEDPMGDPVDPTEPLLAFVFADLTSISLIPEPATWLLLALGGLTLRRRRRRSMRAL